MKRLYISLLLLCAILLASFVIFYYSNQGTLTLSNSRGEEVKINILISETEYEKAKGLSILNKLPDMNGMLFVNESDSTTPFWMLDMKFPIDIIFIDSSKKILTIRKDAQPCGNKNSCSLIFSDKPYRYVLEVNSGFTDKYNIQVGDQLSWK